MPTVDLPLDICLRIKDELNDILGSSDVLGASEEFPGLSFLHQKIDEALTISRSPAPTEATSSKKRAPTGSMDLTADTSHLRKAVRVTSAPSTMSSRNDTRQRGAPVQRLEEEEGSEVEREVQEEEEESGTESECEVERRPERVRDRKKAWETTDSIRSLSEKAHNLVQKLASFGEYDKKTLLAEFGNRLLSETANTTRPRTLHSIINRCKSFEGSVLQQSFMAGVYLMELTLWLEHNKTFSNPTEMKLIATRCNVEKKTLQNMFGEGKRLLFLCLSSSPYILVLLALLGERWNFCKGFITNDISVLTTYLRKVPNDSAGVLIRNIIIPLCYMMKRDFRFPHCSITLPQGSRLDFWETELFESVVGKVDYNFFTLPTRSPAWVSVPPDHLIPSLSLDPKSFLPDDTLVLTYPRTFEKTKCPVKAKTTARWTENERTKATAAPEMKTLDDLRREIEETTMPRLGQPYIKFDTSMVQPKTLKLQDESNNLGALLVTHFARANPQSWDNIVSRIMALYGAEFHHDDSKREGYDFLAIHYHWYNRYAERGEGAPTDTHADQVKRAGSSRVNITQRTPHESKEIAENDAEYAVLKGIMEDFMDFIRANMQHQLPDIYNELHIYCDLLPFNAQSPVYPFAGLVVNFCVSTNGHRDVNDKRICIVIPFGEWDGGEICLYELGLVIKLMPGDVLIFPSCQITHFNLHFNGLRGSLVLHSDRQGDRWVDDRNGWIKHMYKENVNL